MWIRGRQKPIHKRYKKMCTESAQKKLARNASFFVFITRCIRAMVAHTTFVRRGAVGHRIGGLVPQKPAGSYLQMIF